jgi:NAD(P)-dependent dehydrogenase (short-subunit alcohol dehydrogenase family)
VNRLEGRIALVTGGASGIGRAIVERFAEEGAFVMATDLDEQSRAIESLHSGRVHYRRLDVTRPEDWTASFADLEAQFGRPNILVNNAGTSRTGTIASTSDDDWHFVMNTNAFSVLLGCRNAVNVMGQYGGAIVNIASARGRRPGSTQCAYSASKAAVLSLTESVALYCGENDLPIRCNAICPGVVRTNLTLHHAESAGGPQAMAAMAEMQLIARLGEPREIADAALFLASDEAAFVTGATLDVDGGFRIRDRWKAQGHS